MLYYLDTVIVIYAIEGAPAFQARANARLAAANAAGDNVATSDLTRLECLVQPLRNNNVVLQSDYAQFLDKTKVLPLTPAVYDKAAQIRAAHKYPLADSLHLAAAMLGQCDRFLTNDVRLASFHGITVEILA